MPSPCENLKEYKAILQIAYLTKQYKVTSPFGYRYLSGGVVDNHPGIDVGAPYGVRFYIERDLANKCNVVASYTPGNGNFFLINGEKYKIYVLHLAKIFEVKDAKSNIKYVGICNSTGLSEADHFHFQFNLLSDGKPVDPISIIVECGLGVTRASGANNYGTPIYNIESSSNLNFNDPCGGKLIGKSMKELCQ